MVRGPRRTTAPLPGRAAVNTRRLERKMEKVLAQSHGGYAGKSILEILEEELTTACVQYLNIRAEEVSAEGLDHAGWEDRGKRTGAARGKVRGVAISIAMMKHPLRRHEPVWWNLVKKLEKRHLARAKELLPDF